MRIIAMLRGYKDHRINYVIYRLAEEFYFLKHLHKPIKKYSGGTKRKLSTALTLIGNTAIIVLGDILFSFVFYRILEKKRKRVFR